LKREESESHRVGGGPSSGLYLTNGGIDKTTNNNNDGDSTRTDIST